MLYFIDVKRMHLQVSFSSETTLCMPFSYKEEKKLTVMSRESRKRCVPPCSQPISKDDLHQLCLECFGEQHAALARVQAL